MIFGKFPENLYEIMFDRLIPNGREGLEKKAILFNFYIIKLLKN